MKLAACVREMDDAHDEFVDIVDVDCTIRFSLDLNLLFSIDEVLNVLITNRLETSRIWAWMSVQDTNANTIEFTIEGIDEMNDGAVDLARKIADIGDENRKVVT